LEIALSELHACAEHRHALVEIALREAKSRSLEQIHEGGRSEDGPILAELREPRQVAEFRVHPHPGKPQRWLAGAVGADIAVVDVGKVAFEVKFELAGEREVRSWVSPLEINSRAEGTILDVELGIAVRTSV